MRPWPHAAVQVENDDGADEHQNADSDYCDDDQDEAARGL